MKYRIVTQMWDTEAIKQNVLDDCGPCSVAAAIGWASGYTVTPTAAQAVAAHTKVTGQADVQGKPDAGSSLASLAKTVKALGGRARYPKSWADVVASAKQGAAVLVWVQQPIGYPDTVRLSAWHAKWKRGWAKKNPAHLKVGYGHMTSAAFDAELGWQWACPTMTGKGNEAFAVPVLEAELRDIADSKRRSGKHVAADYKHCLLVTYPTATVAPVAPAVPELVPAKEEKGSPAPVEPVIVTPVVPTPAPVVPSKPVPVAPVQAKWTGFRGQLTWVVGRLTGRNIAK